jgi:transcriptional regulator with XRE-family HTH domain
MRDLGDVFRERVRYELMARSWTQVDLAQHSGLSRAQVWQWVHGLRTPGFRSLQRIADALNCEPAQLLKPIGRGLEKIEEWS